MDWQDEHRRRVRQFPDDVREAHRCCKHHREQILASARCGCFYCCSIFSPTAVNEWVDDASTALCPNCGIDAVIGEKSGYEVSPEFLERMKQFWFNPADRV